MNRPLHCLALHVLYVSSSVNYYIIVIQLCFCVTFPIRFRRSLLTASLYVLRYFESAGCSESKQILCAEVWHYSQRLCHVSLV